MKKIGRLRRFCLRNRWIIAVALLFAGTAVFGIWGMYVTLLESARVLGRNLAHSYVHDEELNIAAFRNQIEIGMIYLEELNGRDAEETEKEKWVRDYFKKIKETLPETGVETYAVLGGTLVAENPREGMEEYDFARSEWYQKAVDAKGAVIFSDAHPGWKGEDWVISVAAVEPESGDAIILDLSRETFRAFHENQSLPADGAYYLCDADGQLLYSNTYFQATEEQLETFARNLCGMVDRGEVTEQENVILGVNGERRGVYYSYTENGWFCAMTMTHRALLRGMRSLFGWYVAVFFLFLLTAFLLGYKNRQLFLAVKKEREIVQSLGNSYYAFYRVNVKRNTYEIIKGSEYINARAPEYGEYTKLLHMLAGIMDEESGKEFLKSFSPEKLKELIEQKTEGFGGDFLRRFDGEYRWVNVSLLVDKILGDDEGVLCFRKIHEEKQYQKEYQKLLEDVLATAEMSEKSQRQFYASMSHEMKTPLNIIIGMADMAQRPETGETKVKDCLEKIKHSARQLAGLINDILEKSRLNQKGTGLDKQVFDMKEVALECAEAFSLQAGQEHKKFEMEMDIQEQKVVGRPLYLIQILNQLLSNAMTFTQAGDRIALKVSESGEGDKLRYLFLIEDTGIGMPEEFLPRMFEPYATVNRFDKQRSGKGLGLTIVKNLVMQMGGAVHAESELGKGSCFSVTLPFMAEGDSRAENPAGEDDIMQAVPGEEGGREEAGSGGGTGEKENELGGYRILVAEDNPLNMEIVVELLNMAGAEADCAADGQEAVELFEKSSVGYYDAVVLDMQMPVLDGCGAAEKIRRMKRKDAAVVPIAALTANTLAEDVARTTQAGMNVHMAKPVMAEKLWDTLYGLILEYRKGWKG